MATPLIALVDALQPKLRDTLSAIVVKGQEARCVYALWTTLAPGEDERSEVGDYTVALDRDQVPSGVDASVRQRYPDSVHTLPAHDIPTLEGWVAELERSGTVGRLRVTRGHAGQTSVGTHWGTERERAAWLTGLGAP